MYNSFIWVTFYQNILNEFYQLEIMVARALNVCMYANDVARTLKKLRTLKGDYWIK